MLKQQAQHTENLETRDAIREGLQFLDRSYFHILTADGSPATPSAPTNTATSQMSQHSTSEHGT